MLATWSVRGGRSVPGWIGRRAGRHREGARRGWRASINEASVFASHPRLSDAHDRAIAAFRERINSALCQDENIQLANLRYTISPESEGDGDLSIPQTSNERAYLIGYYEYRATRFHVTGTQGSQPGKRRISWTATVAIVDKWGRERETYGHMFGEGLHSKLINDLVDFLFGKPREKIRGTFSVAGNVCCGDCCAKEEESK
jgi:hypothetical protein